MALGNWPDVRPLVRRSDVRTSLIAVLLLLALGLATPARAGVYHVSDPAILWKVYDGNPELVAAALRLNELPHAQAVPGQLAMLRSLPLASKTQSDAFSPRSLLQRQIDYFERVSQTRPLDPVEAAGLAACYLRLAPAAGVKDGQGRDADENAYRKKAHNLLTKMRDAARKEEDKHFLIHASLAAYYQQNGEYAWALDEQATALRLWPKAWAGWTKTALQFYRECEQYNLRLLQFRKAKPTEPSDPRATLDPFFPYTPPTAADLKPGRMFLDAPLPVQKTPLRFVDEEGNYSPGDLKREEADKIPANAANAILQLAIWQPRDQRLGWLLAELLNANGYVEAAAQMLETLALEVMWKEVHSHLRVLRGAAELLRQLRRPLDHALLSGTVMMITPRASLGTPIAGDVAYAYAALAAPTWVENYVPQQQPQPVEQTPTSSLPFNVQHVVVSFVFGVLCAALLGMQWQALKRRRAESAAAATTAPAQEGAAGTAGVANGPKSESVMQEAPPS